MLGEKDVTRYFNSYKLQSHSMESVLGISVQSVIPQSIRTGLASGISGIAFRASSLYTPSTCSTLVPGWYMMNPFNRPYSFHYAPQGDESDDLNDGHSPRVSVYEVEIA